MPRKPHPSDWDRYFGSRPYRRRGPLGLLTLTLLSGVMISAIVLLSQVAFRARTAKVTQLEATATVLWATAYAEQTKTAAPTATTTPTVTPTPQLLPIGQVTNGGNLRSAPRIAAGNILGQLVAGDQVDILESQPNFYHVRVAKTTGQVVVGTEGWVASSLLTVLPTPTAAPTSTATPTVAATPAP